MTDANLWQRYRDHLCTCGDLGMTLDVSRMSLDDDFWSRMHEPMQRAFDAMEGIEAGEIANPDEKRMVGHYWLRNPSLAPTDDIGRAIDSTVQRIEKFAADVHAQTIAPDHARRFTDVLQIGIGGSALGPQLVAEALGGKRDKLRVHFMDNTDPDGIRRTLTALANRLKSTLVLVVSKSGGTPETRNGMLETRAAFDKTNLDFTKHAIAITGEDSRLDQQAQRENWLARFPMWDWVGGRTSVTSAVGLVPAALQGIDISAFLNGAAKMDALTRQRDMQRNPAALLAAVWHHATNGRGERDMVILPYKDRLALLARYLQQLVMESLGKEHDLDGNVVHQGITVYGNKGSTDQHAFVQQLRDGLDNFFVTFVRVLQDTPQPTRAAPVEVEDGITSGDYLHGFWLGTRQALHEKGRGSITITLDRLDALALGAMIALYERAVGYYAELIRVNAYHQPGVEAGKKAAAAVLALQQRAVAYLQQHPDDALTVEELAQQLDAPDDVESLAHMLAHLAANKRHVVRKRGRYQAKR
ncbi:MAG: glucose-6-phosphate isomerase [Phycisphaeraceae bacterium]